MTKDEAKVIIAKKRKLGWITHEVLLDIWQDGEEINLSLDEDSENILWYKFKEPEPVIIYTGIEGAKQWNKMWDDALKQFKLKDNE